MATRLHVYPGLPQDKFRWVELFVDREASGFATDGRNSAARQVALACMSSWLHLHTRTKRDDVSQP